MKKIWYTIIAIGRYQPSLYRITVLLIMTAIGVQGAVIRFHNLLWSDLLFGGSALSLVGFYIVNQIIAYRAETFQRSAIIILICYLKDLLGDNTQADLQSPSGDRYLVMIPTDTTMGFVLHVDHEDICRTQEHPDNPPEVVLNVYAISTKQQLVVHAIRTTQLAVHGQLIRFPVDTVKRIKLSLLESDAFTGESANPAHIREIAGVIAGLNDARPIWQWKE